jgi:hypothetical protein
MNASNASTIKKFSVQTVISLLGTAVILKKAVNERATAQMTSLGRKYNICYVQMKSLSANTTGK